MGAASPPSSAPCGSTPEPRDTFKEPGLEETQLFLNSQTKTRAMHTGGKNDVLRRFRVSDPEADPGVDPALVDPVEFSDRPRERPKGGCRRGIQAWIEPSSRIRGGVVDLSD